MRRCPSPGCHALISAELSLCTRCRERQAALDVEQSAAEGVRALEAYLAHHAEFADWLAAHGR